MKKILIAGAASTVALAALPMAGVFAADGTMAQTDTVVLTIDSACSLAINNSDNRASTLTPGGNDQNITGGVFTVTCNDAGGWALYAVGNSEATTKTSMDASTAEADDIVTGTTLDGTVSNWAFKLTAGTDTAAGAEIITGTPNFTNFAAIPATQTKVAQHATGSERTTSATVSATYGIGVSSTQSAGTYTGKVLYTLVHPATATAPTEPGA